MRHVAAPTLPVGRGRGIADLTPAALVEPASDRSEVALAARGITKSFGGRAANQDVDFDVSAGEIHALLGENGAGKTTLISVLCGQYLPDAGLVAVRGRPMELGMPRAALLAGIGAVHQDFRLVPRFSVVENVVLGTGMRADAAARASVQTMSRLLGFELDVSRAIKELSVGEQQQVAILRLLHRGLDILILDEPTSVLAPQQCDRLFASLRTLAGAGKAIVLITHRFQDVTAAADRVTVLRRGRVVASRPVAGLTHRDLAFAMVGEDHPAPENAVRAAAGEPVLRLVNVTCRSGRSLDIADLLVRRGEVVGVAGISGNGQRELADVCVGIRAIVGGHRWATSGPIRFIPEDRLGAGLVGAMSVAEDLAFRRYSSPPVSRPWWLKWGEVFGLARRLIAQYGIPVARVTDHAGDLSGGGLQRVLVARELDGSPDLLVAAQPCHGLDVGSAQAVRERLLEARAGGTGVLLFSEDMDELIELADRLLVMFDGRVVGEFPRGAISRTEVGLLMGGGVHEPA